jgi:cell division protein FtsQ
MVPRLGSLFGSRKQPASAGPDEETVVLEDLAHADFSRRRRSERWRRLRIWLLAVLVLALLGLAIWLVFFSDVLVVKKVEVEGDGAVSRGRVVKAAAVPMGKPLARVKLSEIQERVEAIPPIKSAAVTRDWPDTVQITITRRDAVAVIDTGSGFKAFDAEGVMFGQYESRPDGLPLVQVDAKTNRAALSEAAEVITALPVDLAAKVDFVKVISVDQITLVLGNGRSIMWGSAAQSDQKAEVLSVLLKQPGKHLDVSVPSQPTIK